MMDFMIYEIKVAVVLLVFYLFYRFLLKKETFHRFNRVVLVGIAFLSFLLPLCIITIHKDMQMGAAEMIHTAQVPELALEVKNRASWWPMVLALVFWAGVLFVLVRVIVSIISILNMVKKGELVNEEVGCKIILTDRDVASFSWMKYVVIPRKDWDEDRESILIHEKAHIALGHSVDILLVDILSALQWFNPAIWILRSDLRELHEYEADDAVLRAGIDIKGYQYLLVRKAISGSGYSIANSFNHSILKNRITMMTKSKSHILKRWKLLYLLPLVCLCVALQARTVYDITNSPLYILLESGVEKEISKMDFDKIDPNRIKSISILKDAFAKEKYGERASNGVIMVTMKRPQELDKIVVIRYDEKEKEYPFYIVNPEKMPKFQGQDMMAFSRWLVARITPPEGCNHEGTMKVAFEVGADGIVRDVRVLESICEDLDAHVVSLIRQSPKWEPAIYGNKPVAQRLSIPIVFQNR